MACLKLNIPEEKSTALKVAHKSLKDNQKGCTGAYRFGFNSMEMDNEWSGSTGTHLNFGARIYDSRINRWLSVDPAAVSYPAYSPYHFVRNNPILRIDPNGKWDITVHAYNDRSKFGYGIAIVRDRHGEEQMRFKVRLEGAAGRNRMDENADTPLGVYNIPDKDSWLPSSEETRESFGPYPRLILIPESGEIVESKRDLIRLHGGRQETFNYVTGEWESVSNPELTITEGCLRCFDSDIQGLKQLTDKLMADDPLEFGDKLRVFDDLQEVDGYFFTPDDASSLKSKQGLREMNHGSDVDDIKKRGIK